MSGAVEVGASEREAAGEREAAEVRIPQLVWGRRDEGGALVRIRLAGGAELVTDRFDAAIAERLIGADRTALARTSTQEIVAFLNRAGRNWRTDGYFRRRLYVRQLRSVLGYSSEAATAEADRIAALLTSHGRAHDLLEAELGSRFVGDEWVRREECWIRAFPRGLTVHILPGNVPLANVVSIVRGLLTKNLVVAKLPSADMFTATAIALSLLDVDPEHPVARAVSCLHWDRESPEARQLLGAADAVCAWGGAEAVGWARRAAAPEAAFTCFGPKRSVALVGADADLAAAARGIAHDVSVYDQRACFSTQQVFVEDDADAGRLVELLGSELKEHARILPPAKLSDDDAAVVSLSRLEERVAGATVRGPDDLSWTVVEADGAASPLDHPLRRTLFVRRVGCLDEIYSRVGPDVQTVTACPWSVLERHRDELALRGVSRFAEVGLSNLFRVGGTHDGVNPLQGLVRLVSADAPARVHGKGMVRPLDQTEFLRAGEVKELVL